MYYNFGLKNHGYYQLMFTTKWDNLEFPEIYEAAYAVFRTISSLVCNVTSGKVTDSSILIKKTAILYAFIHGLVELHLIGHNEVSKGLDNAAVLIRHMVESNLEL